MKKLSNHIIISLLLLSMFGVGNFAYAEETGFCAQLDPFTTSAEEQFADTVKKYQDGLATRSKELATMRAERDRARMTLRAEWGDYVDKSVALLKSRAVTAEEKSAVAAFQKSLLSALSRRGGNYETAIANFRNGIDKALATRRANISVAIDAYAKDIHDASVAAKAGCTDKGDESALRSKYQESVAAAKSTFAKALEGQKALPTVVETLTTARVTAIDQAEKDFGAAYDSAVEKLKAIFPGA